MGLAALSHSQNEKEASKKKAWSRVEEKLEQWSVGQARARGYMGSPFWTSLSHWQEEAIEATGLCISSSDFPLCCERQRLGVVATLYKPF